MTELETLQRIAEALELIAFHLDWMILVLIVCAIGILWGSSK